ncbi:MULTISPECIES: oxidoreductase [Streptomyces]|uniref:Oxidoreductase n=1 Tax=Streptomyces violaceoruber TaxID=1935 RepID=A0ACD4WN05_STRVN|nr:oxidoreductase [Streptomyces sp. LRa12]THA88755.1 oxidoreductase [Streptomyces sp. LRa12]WOY98912.1 oxidoreductase [Streptomyces violaceoruber]WTE19332.1 oxidoreductase [Streptomyces anthocyanicus]BDD73966.1 oxidoreductase [Streptomyces coelicolor]
MRLDELNAQERRLWDAFPTGRPVDLRDGPSPSDPVVRSEVVAALLLGANPDHDPGDRPALRLTGARLTGRLDIGFTEVAVPVRLTDCRFDEAPLLQGARTRELALTGCVLPGLLADTAQIDGRLVVSHCTLTGPLVLTRTQVNGDLDLRGTVVRHPAGEAIPAVHAHVGGDALCADLAVEGTFRLSGASIEGEFDLEGATLRAPGGHALDAYHIRVAEDFTCHPGFSAEGRIILSGATVAAAIGFCGARLSNPGDIALEAVDVTVGRNFDLGLGLTVDGAVKLDGTRVGTELSFRDAELTHKDGTALSLRATQARETDLRTRRPIDAVVDARNARLGTLYDARETWPTDLRLADATYEALAFPLPAAQRVRWIRRTTGDYFPQPYEQLAAAYRRLGHEDEARTVLLAKQRHRRATLPPHTRLWGHVQDVSVGYGYRPLRAGLWLLALLACGALYFAQHTPAPLEAAKAPPFNAVFYTLDLLVPIITFGQEPAYAPRGPGQWLSYALITAGWILATTVTAGLSRTLNRQ